jgi:hypothetical protein
LSLIASNLLSKVQWLQTANCVVRYDLDRFSVQKVVANGEVPEGTCMLLWDAGHAHLQFMAAEEKTEVVTRLAVENMIGVKRCGLWIELRVIIGLIN